MVVESAMNRDDVILAFRTSLTDGGWPGEWAEDVADENIEIATRLPAGAIIPKTRELLPPRGAKEIARRRLPE